MTIKAHLLTDETAVSDRAAARFLWAVILISLVVKSVLAYVLPLGADEAYATAVAREYSLSFFDHPPISFWLPVLFADLTGLEHPFIYRIPFLLAGAGTTFVLFRIGHLLGGNRTGLWTAVLYAAAPFFVLSGGTFVVPDGPLNLASAISVFFLVKIAHYKDAPPLKYWIYAGLALAVALASKYQAAWIPVAILLVMLFNPTARRWFLQPGVWLGGAVGLFGLVPVLLWNAQHDWISFAFHGGRANGGFNPANFTLTLLAQALFLLPPVLIACVAAVLAALRSRAHLPLFMLALIAIGPVLIFNYVYLTSSAPLAHWTMPGWIFALPLAGFWISEKGGAVGRRYLNWIKAILVIVWVPLFGLVLQVNTGLLTKPFYETPPKWDNTTALLDLAELEPVLRHRGLWDSTDLVMTRGWIEAGLFDTALASQKPTRVLQGIGAHHFTYLSDASVTGSALMLSLSRRFKADQNAAKMLARAQELDAKAILLDPVVITRGGQDYAVVLLVQLTLE